MAVAEDLQDDSLLSVREDVVVAGNVKMIVEFVNHESG